MTASLQLRLAHALAPALMLLFAACSAGESASNAAGRGRGATRASSAGAIESPGEPYREVVVTSGGNLTGRVVFEGGSAADSGVAGAGSSPCGPATDSSATRSGNTLDGVVVWITNVRSGRALPAERRLEIVHEHCTIGPRVRGAVIGSTINVMNQDPIIARFRAVRDGSDDTLAVFRFSEPGQVVPSEEIAEKPGLVSLRAEDRRVLGWVAVFDHPYFAVTTADGAFRIDSVPPGKYRLRAWHERAQRPVEGAIDVQAGKDAQVELKLHLR